jgi:3-isopropylmalate dehydrogenase
VLERGIRTADIWTEGSEKVGTRAMGDAVLAELDTPSAERGGG